MLTIACLLVSLYNHQEVELPKATDLVGKMLGHYYAAQTITGTIQLTASVPSGSASVETQLQIERPGKMFIYQSKDNQGQKKQWVVTADGAGITYDPPRQVSPLETDNTRLYEPMGPKTPLKDLKDAYGAVTFSIGDRSVPLDIAIGRRDDLEHFRLQLKTLSTLSTTMVNGKPAFVIGGDWTEYGNAPVRGKFQMIVSAAGDLYRYVIKQVITIDPKVAPQPLTLTWDVDLKIDGPVDQKLFILQR